MRTMTGYSARSIDDLPTVWDGFAKLVRAGLDISAFGANIMDLPPNYSTRSHPRIRSQDNARIVLPRFVQGGSVAATS